VAQCPVPIATLKHPQRHSFCKQDEAVNHVPTVSLWRAQGFLKKVAFSCRQRIHEGAQCNQPRLFSYVIPLFPQVIHALLMLYSTLPSLQGLCAIQIYSSAVLSYAAHSYPSSYRDCVNIDIKHLAVIYFFICHSFSKSCVTSPA